MVKIVGFMSFELTSVPFPFPSSAVTLKISARGWGCSSWVESFPNKCWGPGFDPQHCTYTHKMSRIPSADVNQREQNTLPSQRIIIICFHLSGGSQEVQHKRLCFYLTQPGTLSVLKWQAGGYLLKIFTNQQKYIICCCMRVTVGANDRLIQKVRRKTREQNALGNKSFEKSPCVPGNPESQEPSQSGPWLREDERRPSALTSMTSRPCTSRK